MRANQVDKAACSEFAHEAHHDQDEFRVELARWVCPQERAKMKAGTKRKHKQIDEKRTYDAKETINDYLVLDEDCFGAHMGFWRKWTDKKCTEEFARLHKLQRGKQVT